MAHPAHAAAPSMAGENVEKEILMKASDVELD